MSGRTLVRIVGGVAAAVVLWGIAVQPLAGDVRVPPRPNVSCDSLNAPTVTSVQAEEGFARARYTVCGARLTANEPIVGAPWIVILGDSYVEARQVSDDETVGSRLERISRVPGTPYNVRQYGWAGGAPVEYVSAAKDMLGKWNPRRVVVVLFADDFETDSARGIDLASVPPWTPAQPAAPFALSALLRRRWSLIMERSPQVVRRAAMRLWPEYDVLWSGPPPGVAPTVRALREAYGSRLLLVYLSTVVAEGDDVAPKENALLESCRRQAVQCISLRPAMLELRAKGRLARGFSNTTIGVGHLNADGHDLLAREIWKAIR